MSSGEIGHAVFLSYASVDKLIADAIVAALESADVPCWVAPRDIPSGLPYADAIVKAIRASKILLVVFTSHANASPHVLREVERAVHMRIPILCVRVENILPTGAMEYLVSAVHWLDVFNADQPAYCRLAVQQVNQLLQESSQSAQSMQLGGGAAFDPSPLAKVSRAGTAIAVTPFVDSTREGASSYLCQGLVEDITARLSQIRDVRVLSSYTVSLMHQKTADPIELARNLQADWLLEGSIYGDTTAMRAQVRLIDAHTQSIQWSGSLDFDATRVLQAQAQIADQVIQNLGIHLSPVHRQQNTLGQTHDATALDLYMRARFHAARRDCASLERAVQYYEQALQHDPSFVRAWALLAEAYILLGNYGSAAGRQAGQKAFDLASRATAINASVPEAHLAMGLSLRTSNFGQAAERFRMALALAPSHVEAHHYLSHVYVTMGLYSLAEQEELKALAIDPLYPVARAHLVRALMYQGKRDEALRHLASLQQDNLAPILTHSAVAWLAWCEGDFATALERLAITTKLDPSNVFCADAYADVLCRQGRPDLAVESLTVAIQRQTTSHILRARLAKVHLQQGEEGRAAQFKAQAVADLNTDCLTWLNPRSAVYYYNLAWIEAVCGETESALSHLAQASDQGYHHYAEIQLRPDWEQLRQIGSGMELLARMKERAFDAAPR